MGKLFIVPTPIGNLEDITLRALRLLREVDVIYCEDTRTSSVLLSHYQITTPVKSYHMHNEHTVTPEIVNRLKGESLAALITDAGTPAISDPGFLLVRACIRAGIEVECLPGPTAFVPALVESGLPCEHFCFLGFPPAKKGRSTFFRHLAEINETIVLYESPHKIEKTLNDIATHMGPDTSVSISRELTKKFHQTIRGTIVELCEKIKNEPLRGEIVIVIGRKSQRKNDDV